MLGPAARQVLQVSLTLQGDWYRFYLDLGGALPSQLVTSLAENLGYTLPEAKTTQTRSKRRTRLLINHIYTFQDPEVSTRGKTTMSTHANVVSLLKLTPLANFNELKRFPVLF